MTRSKDGTAPAALEIPEPGRAGPALPEAGCESTATWVILNLDRGEGLLLDGEP